MQQGRGPGRPGGAPGDLGGGGGGRRRLLQRHLHVPVGGALLRDGPGARGGQAHGQGIVASHRRDRRSRGRGAGRAGPARLTTSRPSVRVTVGGLYPGYSRTRLRLRGAAVRWVKKNSVTPTAWGDI